MKWLSLIILLSFLLFCCSEQGKQSPELPEGIVGEREMVQMLVQFALAESAANVNSANVQMEKTDSVYAFDPLRELKIRKTQYDSSLRFYSQHPEIYKRIYDSVLVLLSEYKTTRVFGPQPTRAE